MLIHPPLDHPQTLKLDGMAQAFIELEAQEQSHSLAHAEWLALLLDREIANRNTRRFQTRPGPPVASQPSRDRGCRFPHATAARQGAVPAVGHLPLDC